MKGSCESESEISPRAMPALGVVCRPSAIGARPFNSIRAFAAGGLGGLCLAAIVAGCMSSAPEPRPGLASSAEREMTLGVVQKEIRAGLAQGDVVTALGSPNIVTRDGTGRETWVYDKVASEASYSTSARYGTILVLGASNTAGASSQSQRTLTVVIRFGSDQRVESFSYHSSRF